MPRKEVAKRLALIFTAVIAIFLTLFIAAASIFGYFAYKHLTVFSTHSELSFEELRTMATKVWQKKPVSTNGKTNILILGVDTLDTRNGSPPLTDTIVLASIDTTKGAVSMLSLPRDLWSNEYQTKINALYYYGIERFPDKPERFAEETIESMIDVPIHHVVVMNMDALAEMVDILGGVEIDVPNSFTDEKFPRPDVDVTTVRDPNLLYQTVNFQKGIEKMSGQRVLEFVRSRNSEGDEGTDLARSKRQQLVLQAMIKKLMNKETISNPETMGQLLRYYLNSVDRYLPVEEAGALTKALVPFRDKIHLNTTSLSIYPDDENGVIWNPPLSTAQNQWVYEIRNHDNFKMEIDQLLQYNEPTAN